ncbi:scavenger receptor cysteine-rich type 1 protein M130-like [Gracilinanus agilis]|uniref:scavenger receptor cysteine-rich type 1 protein M130-like n=1 Tax=Gracilinanus agilis TaxID=191870 RepID=UPI001CFE66CF|nr:scavenger receptor cysteine-rich type 1 protein M130-like [Gracilinanus agilis]
MGRVIIWFLVPELESSSEEEFGEPYMHKVRIEVEGQSQIYISSWADDTPGDGYDDAEELSGPEIPPDSQMNEEGTMRLSNEWDKYSEACIALENFVADSGTPKGCCVGGVCLGMLLCDPLPPLFGADMKLRLVNGKNRCEGRLEVFHNGEWGTVCDNGWDNQDARTVCIQLRCGNIMKAHKKAHFGKGSGRIWLDDVACKGKELDLSECQHREWGQHNCDHEGDAGVTCLDGANTLIRLVNGQHQCMGRVEIFYQLKWGTVCDQDWDHKDATVVCKQLGCGNAIQAHQKAHFGRGSRHIWLSNFNCNGKELDLLKCQHGKWGQHNCDHGDDAGVTCSGGLHLEVRLVDGKHHCEGRLEVLYQEKWGTVCDNKWDDEDATVVCQQLRCGPTGKAHKKAHFGRGSGSIWLDEVACDGNESALSDCRHREWGQHDCTHMNDAGVTCLGGTDLELRLVNGKKFCEGRLEVLYQGEWGTVCDYGWDEEDAAVACKQLGCGSVVEAHGNAHFGEGAGPIWLSELVCSGQESALSDCGHSGWGQHSCRHLWDAGVTCLENGQLRLVNGERDPCSGRVEIYYNDTWGTICDDSWDMSDAHVVCRQLGCGVAFKVMDSSHFGKGSGPIWLDELSCFGNESYLAECPSLHWGQHDCSHKEDAGVICSESLDLRLVSDDYDCAGWLEVFYNGTWGSVCSNLMDSNTVSVICRHLSCGNRGYLDFHSSHRSLPVKWVDKINCQGQESSLWHCPSQPWNHASCFQEQEAYIICKGRKNTDCPPSRQCTDKDKLQLRGGETPCSGRVEIWHDGSWGTVCDDSWDLAEANVVCQQLGCGSALAALERAAFGPGNGTIWLDEVQCRGKESSLWDCPAEPWGQNDCKHDEDAAVMCSGRITKTVPASLNPGFFSLPWILYLILGALLFLLLFLLGIQLHKKKVQQQAVSGYGDSFYETMYQEINYELTENEEDLLSNPGYSEEEGNGKGKAKQAKTKALLGGFCSRGSS